jgi:hypothetical protein
MGGVSESNRQRVAFVLIGLGAALIVLGFSVLILQDHGASSPGLTTRPVAVAPAAKARIIKQVLFWTIILILLFLVSTTAFLRWSRHYRRSLLRKPHTPTPNGDVWAMHKLPEGAIEEWGSGDGGQGEPPGPAPGPPDSPARDA